MANMAYFNGTNSYIDFEMYSFSFGDGSDLRFLFTIKVDEKPATGNHYSLGFANINDSGQLYIDTVTSAIDVTDGNPHTCEITKTQSTHTITITVDSNTPDSGTSTWDISEAPGLGGGDSTWFKGFLSNYQLYVSNTKVLDMPMTSDFHDIAGHFTSGKITPEHVSIFDTDDLSSAVQLTFNTNAFEGAFFHMGEEVGEDNYVDYYHYWCSEGTTSNDNWIYAGSMAPSTLYFTQIGEILNFSLPTAIPQGARITEANVIFVGRHSTGNSMAITSGTGAKSRITGWKTTTPSVITNLTTYRTIRGTLTGGASDSNLTDNQVAIDDQTIAEGDVYTSPSLVNMIQEIVNLGNISNIAFFWDDYEKRSNSKGYIVDGLPYLIVKHDTVDVECSLTYDANEGTGTVPTDSTPYDPGDPVTVQANIDLTRTGYDFMGWATHRDGTGTVIKVEDIGSSAGTFTIQASTVLYAKWEARLTVTYNANGAGSGTTPADTTIYHPGDKIIVPGNTGELTRTGYTFRSWNSSADGKGDTYLAGSELTFTDSITLYANWDLAILSSEIFFVFNMLLNGTVQGFRYLPIPEGAANPVAGKPSNDMRQAGFAVRFDLPYVIPRGTIIKSASLRGVGGLSYMNIESGTGANCLIHAHRVPAPEAITDLTDYKSRRGIAPDGTVDETIGHVTTASVNFTGLGITTGAAFETTSLVSILQELVTMGDVSSILFFIDDHEDHSEAGHACSIALPIELNYSYDCTFNYNGNGSTGGSVPVVSNSPYSYGDSVTVSGQGSMIRGGYTFVKWNTAADGTGTNYDAGDTFIITANTTLYAQWASAVSSASDIFFVGYSQEGAQWMQVLIPDMAPNPGVGDISGARVNKFGYAVRFVLPAPIPMGATITSASLKGTAGALFSSLLPEGVEAVYGGTGTSCFIHAQADLAPSAITTLAQYVSRRGLVPDGSVNEGIGEVTTASFDFSNQPITTPGVPFTTGSLVSILQELVNMGDVSSVLLFVDDHKGLSVDNHVYSIALSQELNYEYGCTVAYDGNGNTGGTEPVDIHSPYSSFDPVTVLGNKGSLTRSGYTFVKWNTAANGSGTDYDPADTFFITNDTILYAQWKVAVSKVVTIVAWDTVNECGKTGDAANITVRGVRDGVEYAPVDATVTEVDPVNMPGIYTVSLTRMENDCYFNTVGGKSSTSGVVIKPTFWRNEEEKESCCIPCCKKC